MGRTLQRCPLCVRGPAPNQAPQHFVRRGCSVFPPSRLPSAELGAAGSAESSSRAATRGSVRAGGGTLGRNLLPGGSRRGAGLEHPPAGWAGSRERDRRLEGGLDPAEGLLCGGGDSHHQVHSPRGRGAGGPVSFQPLTGCSQGHLRVLRGRAGVNPMQLPTVTAGPWTWVSPQVRASGTQL